MRRVYKKTKPSEPIIEESSLFSASSPETQPDPQPGPSGLGRTEDIRNRFTSAFSGSSRSSLSENSDLEEQLGNIEATGFMDTDIIETDGREKRDIPGLGKEGGLLLA